MPLVQSDEWAVPNPRLRDGELSESWGRQPDFVTKLPDGHFEEWATSACRVDDADGSDPPRRGPVLECSLHGLAHALGFWRRNRSRVHRG
jgi:hypothetical protein